MNTLSVSPQVHCAKASACPQLTRFYKRNGYKGRPGADEEIIWLTIGQQMNAACRLEKIPEGLFMRGFWVARDKRGTGSGTILLQALQDLINHREEPCICFAYPDALEFYLNRGLRKATPEELSPRLQQLQQRYSRNDTATALIYRP